MNNMKISMAFVIMMTLVNGFFSGNILKHYSTLMSKSDAMFNAIVGGVGEGAGRGVACGKKNSENPASSDSVPPQSHFHALTQFCATLSSLLASQSRCAKGA